MHMEPLLHDCDSAIAALAGVQPGALPAPHLTDGVLRIQGFLDRLTLVHGQWIAAADAAGAWHGSGARSMADWLATQTKTSLGDATEKLQLGESAKKAPELADAVASGQMSAKAAAKLHKAIKNAPQGTDVKGLVDAVKGSSPSDAQAAAEKWEELNRPRPETPEEAAERRYQRRSVTSGLPEDGLVTSIVVLPVLESRQFMHAISSIAGKPGDGDSRTTAQRLADGLVQLADAWARGEVKGGRERATILLTMDLATYTGATDTDARTASSDRIPAHVARRLAEDAWLQRVVHEGSKILNLGHSVRWPTDAQYRALMVRDGGCRWAGCSIPATWCQIDHLVQHPLGGPTDLSNLWLLCAHHHTEKHRPGVTFTMGGEGTDGAVVLTTANGTVVTCPPRGEVGARPTHRRPTPAAA